MPRRTPIGAIAIRHLSGRKVPVVKPQADVTGSGPTPTRIAYVRLPYVRMPGLRAGYVQIRYVRMAG